MACDTTSVSSEGRAYILATGSRITAVGPEVARNAIAINRCISPAFRLAKAAFGCGGWWIVNSNLALLDAAGLHVGQSHQAGIHHVFDDGHEAGQVLGRIDYRYQDGLI